jgi:hypothetical protein
MVAVLASLVAAGTLAGPAPQPRQLVAGPALAGDRVVWGDQRAGLNVLRTWPTASPLWQSTSSWFSGPLAGSQTLVAFSRSYDGCPGQPGVACPVETQAMAGRPRGSLRPLGPAERCSAGGATRRLSVSGPLVAYFALGCSSSGGTVSVHDGARTVFRRAGAVCCDVSIAGSRLAWRSSGSVDVFDLRTHRIVYRVDAPLLEPIAAFDVQADGKLAVVLGQAPDGRASLAWRAPGTAGLQRLRLRIVMPAIGPAVRIVGDRIVAVTAVPGSTGPASSSELVVADLHGHVRTLARFAAPVERAGAIDASGTRVTWASRRITSRREDCPPPGQGRPCRLLQSGTETIWVAGLTSGAPRPVARWAFADSP